MFFVLSFPFSRVFREKNNKKHWSERPSAGHESLWVFACLPAFTSHVTSLFALSARRIWMNKCLRLMSPLATNERTHVVRSMCGYEECIFDASGKKANGVTRSIVLVKQLLLFFFYYFVCSSHSATRDQLINQNHQHKPQNKPEIPPHSLLCLIAPSARGKIKCLI